MKTVAGILAVTLAISLGGVGIACAEGRGATAAQQSEAVGHYARARSLLIEALREFDRGNHIASPEAFLDADAFRDTLISRADELERVLDPQPRITKGGVRYNPDSRLIGAELRK